MSDKKDEKESSGIAVDDSCTYVEDALTVFVVGASGDHRKRTFILARLVTRWGAIDLLC